LQAIELWEKPIDLVYKDAQYNVGISEHKKMIEEFEEKKKREKEEYSK